MPRILSLLACLALSTAWAGCGGGAASSTKPSRADTARKEQQAAVDSLLRKVREAEALWRVGLGQRRRLREQLMLLSGTSGVGLEHKRVQFMVRSAGLANAQVTPKALFDKGVVVRGHPVLVRGEGSWHQLMRFLGQVDGSTPRMAVIDLAIQRIKAGETAQVDRLRLEALVAVFSRQRVPPPATGPPTQGAIPLAAAAARRQLTDRLLLVRAATAGGRRELRHLRVALGRLEEDRVPVSALFGPLAPLLGEARLTRMTATARRATLEGIVPENGEAARLVDAIEHKHPGMWGVETAGLRRQPAPGGWETVFTLKTRLGKRPVKRPKGAAPVREGAPPPAAYVAPASNGAPVAPTTLEDLATRSGKGQPPAVQPTGAASLSDDAPSPAPYVGGSPAQ